jgi:muramoyltetrapeptide carboxypeptidase
VSRLARYGVTVQFAEGYRKTSLTIAEKVSQLETAFQDPAVDVVMCYWGGHSSNQLLEHIDYRKIAAHPKPFVGYSDCTTLLHALHTQAGIPTIHGAAFVSMTKESSGTGSIESLLAALQGTLDYDESDLTPQPGDLPLSVRDGSCRGMATGGHIALVSALVGTRYLLLPKNHILFLECSEEYSLEQCARYLYHLRQAGVFVHTSAVIFSRFTPESAVDQIVLRDLLLQVLPVNIPIMINFESGHTDPILSIQFGGEYSFFLSGGSLMSLRATRVNPELLSSPREHGSPRHLRSSR